MLKKGVKSWIINGLQHITYPKLQNKTIEIANFVTYCLTLFI